MKVGIVGTGLVGSTAAYALVMRGVGREIVLVDKNAARAAAEADDIRHAVPFAATLDVQSGQFSDLRGASVVLLCAGANQKPGETRLELLKRNAEVFHDVVPQVLAQAPDAVLCVATNPVDVMTHLTARLAGQAAVAAGRVFGSGTTLDTARFRSLLGGLCGVDPHHIHGYVVGEHGDSELLTWSLVSVGGMPLDDFIGLRGLPFDEAARGQIEHCVRHAAYGIIAGKGATHYGIGSALARIVQAVLHDQRSILTVCSPMADVLGVRDVTLSLPHLVGGGGVQETFPMPLAADENERLKASARVIRAAIDELGS
jgi:L-lactate dehydrogenase